MNGASKIHCMLDTPHQYRVDVDTSTSALVLERLWLTDFRSLEALDLEFARGVTALVGPNGSGKTNIVEAIGWLMSMRSFRGAPNEALVRQGADRQSHVPSSEATSENC